MVIIATKVKKILLTTCSTVTDHQEAMAYIWGICPGLRKLSGFNKNLINRTRRYKVNTMTTHNSCLFFSLPCVKNGTKLLPYSNSEGTHYLRYRNLLTHDVTVVESSAVDECQPSALGPTRQQL